MFSKLAILSLIALANAAPQHQKAAQYPAGVDPSACPGFPICDNALLHNPQARWGGAPAQQWNPQPAQQWNQWNQQPAQQWNSQPAQQWNQWDQQPAQQWNQQPAQQWNQGPSYAPVSNHLPGAGGDKYPAGVNPHTCPNYPFCDTAAGHGAPAAAPPLPGWTERQYPAGVSAHECPNFPYCH